MAPAPWRRIGALLACWWVRSRRRARLRRELPRLDDHLLRDAGLSRYDLEREAVRPFWRA